MPPRVLIVDDERAFAEILAELISSEGYVAERAHTGREAMSMLSDADRCQPDVLICDVMLPEMRGDQLACAVRERFARSAGSIAESASRTAAS